nr:PQQ-dependent sugar dehydrogenase [Methanolinea mesophila]
MPWKKIALMVVLVVVIALAFISIVPLMLPPGGPPADSRLSMINLPAGFHIGVYTPDVPGAREMALGPEGMIFVGTRGEGKVYAVIDENNDSVADRVEIVAGNLYLPNGVAYRDGALYVAEVNRVLRYDDISSRLDTPPPPVVVNGNFPSDTTHGWKFIAFGPDGKLYVPVGMPCNICIEDTPLYGTIMRMNPDGSDLEIYASGIRNTVGFDWDPETGFVWFTDNGQDFLGEDLPPDELNVATTHGQNFGFPLCYGDNIPDPAVQGNGCPGAIPPALELPAHVAPLGMEFYRGSMFPAEYRGRIFIAEHGSWNRVVPVGYQVVSVTMENGTAVSWEPFASGWLQGASAWGRPVDVLTLPDGSLLVSDDQAGAIYRIWYG